MIALLLHPDLRRMVRQTPHADLHQGPRRILVSLTRERDGGIYHLLIQQKHVSDLLYFLSSIIMI